MTILHTLSVVVVDAAIFAWDFVLAILNLITPALPRGRVTPAGHPGYAGKWPDFVPPTPSDSRCSCPALNALANHGVLPHDGRNISFRYLNETVRASYNFSPSFCAFVPRFAANMLGRDYVKDTFDLQDLDLHNGIEHDASLTRLDTFLERNQGHPHLPFIDELLASATGQAIPGSYPRSLSGRSPYTTLTTSSLSTVEPPSPSTTKGYGATATSLSTETTGSDEPERILTVSDLSKIIQRRHQQAQAANPEFSLSLFHKIFGASNSSTLLTIFSGRVSDLTSFLREERIPEGWESGVRARWGLTLTVFQTVVAKVMMAGGK